MRFLRRNVYPVLVLAVLALSSLLAARQYLFNETAHTRMREDFLLLHAQGQEAGARHLYQTLAQDIGQISDLALILDQQRLDLLALQTNSPLAPDSLLFKYRAGIHVELERRTAARVAQALQRAQAR